MFIDHITFDCREMLYSFCEGSIKMDCSVTFPETTQSTYMNISQEKPHGLALSILGITFAMCTVVCGINSVHCNLTK